VVRPAVAMEATATIVMLSIILSFDYFVCAQVLGASAGFGLRVCVAAAM
jgi:hypothetical protein